MPDHEVIQFRIENGELLSLVGLFCERVNRIGTTEAERRIGFRIEELADDAFDIVSGDDLRTIYVRPSAKLRRAVDAVGEI